MIDPVIYECRVFLPTLERAKKRVPSEFLPCYSWFSDNAGAYIPRLPHHMDPKPRTPIPLSRDSGIYTPGRERVTFLGAKSYALSIHSNDTSFYADRVPIPLSDGTWIFDYSGHEGADKRQNYNQSLMNCLADGVPVGVMIKEGIGYRVLGLAFVERYNSATNMFTLHGPISQETQGLGAFAIPGFDELSAYDQNLIQDLDETDERRLVSAEQVRREQQGQFRLLLLDAYQGACAITGTDVSQVLQAAHINPYRGKRSQMVSNGILLRADLHLLYDAHLISIDPSSLTVRLSERLKETYYCTYNMKSLRIPDDPLLTPDKRLLSLHFKQFSQENRLLSA